MKENLNLEIRSRILFIHTINVPLPSSLFLLSKSGIHSHFYRKYNCKIKFTHTLKLFIKCLMCYFTKSHGSKFLSFTICLKLLSCKMIQMRAKDGVNKRGEHVENFSVQGTVQELDEARFSIIIATLCGSPEHNPSFRIR